MTENQEPAGYRIELRPCVPGTACQFCNDGTEAMYTLFYIETTGAWFYVVCAFHAAGFFPALVPV